MPQPTIAERLRRRFILLSTDAGMEQTLRARLSPGWEMVVVRDLDEVGDWNDILLYRFILLDLDETQAFDPQEVVRRLRMEHLLNIAVLCFGGDRALRDTMRLLRADRFFEREEIVQRLPEFLESYGW